MSASRVSQGVGNPARFHKQRIVAAALVGIAALILASLGTSRLLQRRRLAGRDSSLALARSEFQATNYPMAEKDFAAAMAVPGLPVTVWRELGLAYQMDRKPLQAIDAYKKSLAGESHDAFTWNVLGNLYRDARQYPDAETAYTRSLLEDSRLLIVAVNLGHLYVLEGKSAQAVSFLSQHYDASRGKEEVGLQLASLYIQTGKAAEARTVLQSILAADPASVRAISIMNSL